MEEPHIYAYIDTNGVPGWNLMQVSEPDTVEVTTDTIQEKLIESIDIRNIRIEDGKLVLMIGQTNSILDWRGYA